MIVFDVGANNGDSCIHYAYGPAHTVYAFEPTPEMIAVIKSKTAGLAGYKLTEKAVSNFNGKAKFNVAGQCDWGCSSLHEFSDDLATTWPGRGDFVKTHEIEVDVITLESFIEENGIEVIDHLHIDTQGSDLDVLKGLGKYIDIVQSGVAEASKPGYELYKGTDNSKDDMIAFLTEHGFEVTHIQVWSEEFNIGFKRIL